MKEIKYKKIKPTFTKVLVTADTYEEDGMIDSLIYDIRQRKGDPKLVQKVLAVGTSVPEEIQVGCLVELDFTMYAFTQQIQDNNSIKNKSNKIDSYKADVFYDVPTVEVDGQQCYLIDDRCIKFVVTEFEEVEVTKKTKQPASKLILPNTGIIH